jgi:hypothetical protein
MPSTQLALDQPVHDPSIALAAQRSGYDAQCLQHIAQAEQHVRALFLGKDGATPHPALQTTPGLMLRCLGQASAHAHLMWAAARAGDAASTHKTCQAWWRAVKEALQRATAPSEETPHA